MRSPFLHPASTGMVSCIIPAYNAARFLEEAVASIAEQNIAPLEVIVADDGSTDHTAAVARAIDSADVRVVQQQNAGSASARNLGLSLARGEFIALLDADDIWLPGKLSSQLAVFAEHPGVGACTTLMQNFWEAQFSHEAEQNPHLVAPQPGAASTFVGRRCAFEAIGGFDPSIRYRDLQEWLLRAKFAGWQLHTIQEVLVRRRIHGDNDSRRRVTGQAELLDLAIQALARKRKHMS